ncbi:MAG: hypothetical protein WDO18_09970 [Acidobacteriota bacterium]
MRRVNKTFYQRHEATILGSSSILLLLAAWEAAWQAKLISPLFFSGPSAIAKQAVYAWTEGNLKGDLIYSSTNFILGFTAAVIAGVARASSSAGIKVSASSSTLCSAR